MQFLTPSEIDNWLRLTEGSAEKFARAGLLPAVLLPGGQVRFERGAVEAFLATFTGLCSNSAEACTGGMELGRAKHRLRILRKAASLTGGAGGRRK